MVIEVIHLLKLENSITEWISARTGTPIYATGDGVVYKADASLSGYGNHIEINHGYGYKTLYAHLSKYNCRPGQRVKRGDIIGYVEVQEEVRHRICTMKYSKVVNA